MGVYSDNESIHAGRGIVTVLLLAGRDALWVWSGKLRPPTLRLVETKAL